MNKRKPDLGTIGGRIEDARLEANLSRKELSEQTGISDRTIEKYEYGTSAPTAVRLEAIAKALGVHISQLFNSSTGKRQEPRVSLNEREVRQTPASLVEAMSSLRQDGFEQHWRKAPVLLSSLEGSLKDLSEAELFAFAIDLGIKKPLSLEEFEQICVEDIERACAVCLLLEESIIDLAIFGRDLTELPDDAVSSLAEGLDLQADQVGFLGVEEWSNKEEALRAIRSQAKSRLGRFRIPDLLVNDEQSEEEAA